MVNLTFQNLSPHLIQKNIVFGKIHRSSPPTTKCYIRTTISFTAIIHPLFIIRDRNTA